MSARRASRYASSASACRPLRVASAERLPARLGELLEPLRIELTRSNAQPVPRGRGAQDPGVAERAPQTRHVDLDGLDGAGLRVLAPQGHGDALSADGLV